MVVLYGVSESMSMGMDSTSGIGVSRWHILTVSFKHHRRSGHDNVGLLYLFALQTYYFAKT